MKTKQSRRDQENPGAEQQKKTTETPDCENRIQVIDPVARAIGDILAAAGSVSALSQSRAQQKMSNNRANGVVRELKELAKVISRYGCQPDMNKLLTDRAMLSTDGEPRY